METMFIILIFSFLMETAGRFSHFSGFCRSPRLFQARGKTNKLSKTKTKARLFARRVAANAPQVPFPGIYAAAPCLPDPMRPHFTQIHPSPMPEKEKKPREKRARRKISSNRTSPSPLHPSYFLSPTLTSSLLLLFRVPPQTLFTHYAHCGTRARYHRLP